MYSLNFIKCPVGLVKKANEQDLLSPLLFYFQLKGINKTSSFNKEEFYQICRNYTNLSKSAIYTNITKLKELTWIKEINNKIILCKYDYLFQYFGFDLTLRKRKGLKNRKGTFKILKISTSRIKQLFLEICKLEIKQNILTQYRALNYKVKLLRKKSSLSNKLVDNSNIARKFLKSQINFDITLSARGISRILGFKSPCTGFSIAKKLELQGDILYQNRQVGPMDDTRNLITFLF